MDKPRYYIEVPLPDIIPLSKVEYKSAQYEPHHILVVCGERDRVRDYLRAVHKSIERALATLGGNI